MHNCPDCGEECDCEGELGVDMHCGHVCKTPAEIDYEQDVDDGMFELFEDDDIICDEDF